MRYEAALAIEEKARELIEKLNLNHIQIENIACIKSYGSKSKGTIARCHALGKVMQKGMKRKAFYTLEFLGEKFDKLNEEDKIKTIIHELLHIPNTFGGGFKHHNYVNERTVNLFYKQYKNEN